MKSYFVLAMLGPWEIIIIVLVILILFGGRKIPELMRGLGRGLKEFKDASKGLVDVDEDNKDTKKTTDNESLTKNDASKNKEG